MLSIIEESAPADYVQRIRAGDPAGIEALYRDYYRGVRYFFLRQLGPGEADDGTHEAILIAVQAIRRGQLRDPARLPGFIRTIVRRLIATSLRRRVNVCQRQLELGCAVGNATREPSPEAATIAQEQSQIMREFLLALSLRDREILTRFYLLEQSVSQICQDMGLTETQFRLLKSRAKARLTQNVRRAHPPPCSLVAVEDGGRPGPLPPGRSVPRAI